MSGPYTPPPEFKPINTPIIQDISLKNSELWLVRIQDSQLRPDDFKEKSLKLTLTTTSAEKLGSFENQKGTQFEILDLEPVTGIKPFAFLPESKGPSLNVHRVSRQVAIVRGFDPIVFGDIHEEDSIVSGGKQTRSRGEESQTGSASIGGLSTVESLQENEGRISLDNISKSVGEKSKRKQKELEIGTEQRASREDVTESGKESERGVEAVSLKSVGKEKKGERPVSELAMSPERPSDNENEETSLKENLLKSGKKLKRERPTEEVELLSSPNPSQHGMMSSEKKPRKPKKIKTGEDHE